MVKPEQVPESVTQQKFERDAVCGSRIYIYIYIYIYNEIKWGNHHTVEKLCRAVFLAFQ
jgi:hypothetical protein